jgi:hypothetical protein
MKLRKTIQRKIIELLDNSCFTAEDFDITFSETDDIEALIDIKLLHDKKYFFDVFYDEGKYLVTIVPGEISEKDCLVKTNVNQLLELIPAWAEEVRRELQAENSTINNIEYLRNIIAERLNNESLNDEFTVIEINDLQEKLKELEKRISQLEHDKIITSGQFEEFKKGIQQVSADVEYYPKTTWLKTAPNKLLKIMIAIGKSQEGRKILADGARKILGLE